MTRNPTLDARWDEAYRQAEAIVERECGWTPVDCVRSTDRRLTIAHGNLVEEPHLDYCDYCREVIRVAERIRFSGERRGT